MLQLVPSVQDVPFIDTNELANALLGIALADTAKDGAVAGFVTAGTSHDGQLAEGAETLVTVPLWQGAPVFDKYPEASTCKQK